MTQDAKLSELAADPSSALELGKAAEHLVCADLILLGHRAFLSDQGLPYDVVVDLGGRLIRIQVKGACFARNCSARSRVERVTYSFFVRRVGKSGRKRLSDADCDLVALVALDIRVVAYLPIQVCGATVQLLPPASDHVRVNPAGARSWARTIAEFSFENAVEGDAKRYAKAKIHTGGL